MNGKPYDNNMRGVLFKNDKEGIETRADFRGTAEIEHIEYHINAWVNVDRNGKKFMSIRFRPKHQERGEAPPAPRSPPQIKPPTTDEPFNDDIPF